MRPYLGREFARKRGTLAAGLPLVLLSLVLAAVAGCGTPPPAAPPGELLLAYTLDKNVVHDVLDENPDGSGEDRQANIAAYFSRDELASFLFGAAPCLVRPQLIYSSPIPDLGCPLPPAVTAEAARATGGSGEVLVRGMLVRHDDGRLELMPLYVAGSGAGALLVDTTGQTYSGGLEDFRRHNDLLDRSDQVLVAAEPGVTTGDGRLVVVSGSTAPPVDVVVLLVLLVLLVVVVGAVVVIRRRRPPASEG
ncbi:hypothetical protein [Pseudonocardia kunmingensis]|uniref:hypothetical protein n=1 Tax=Pseudonocardia kunmingensis TaxID=630975 RepID=UPI00114DFD0D|nr:hypothetical protein [Pseudonocardia kunmingensis]